MAWVAVIQEIKASEEAYLQQLSAYLDHFVKVSVLPHLRLLRSIMRLFLLPLTCVLRQFINQQLSLPLPPR